MRALFFLRKSVDSACWCLHARVFCFFGESARSPAASVDDRVLFGKPSS